MIYKELLSVVAIALTFIAFFPYIRAINQGKIRPHIFSWVIWSITTFIVFLAQLQDNGGVGAWPIGLSGLITLYIAVASFFKRADTAITRTDWAFFGMAMISLSLWFITSDSLGTVVMLTTVDILGFGPTLRKAYVYPFEEQLTFFGILVVRNCVSIVALENYSITTILFPAAVMLACLILILMVWYLRRS